MKSLITVDEIRKLMPLLSLAKAGAFVPHLEAAMTECEIDSKRRRCAFLANLAHESQQLNSWIEDLNYSANRLLVVFPYYFKDLATAKLYAHNRQAIANRVYANRMGNSNEASGDGWKFRGRGPIGLTGRNNYRRFGDLLGVDLEEDPGLASRTDLGFRIAALFWKLGGCNELADNLTLKGDAADRGVLTQICRRINGGLNGLGDRLNFFRVAKQVLHGDEPALASISPSEGEEKSATTPESVAQAESSAGVSPESDSDLLGAAVNASTLKKAGRHIGPRIAKHSSAALSFCMGLYEAHKIATLLVVLVLIAGAGWVIYHNRKRLKPRLKSLLLKLTE